MPSKADLSVNWRAPRPLGGKPPSKVFSAFAKKIPLVNPYPALPHLWCDLTVGRTSAPLKCKLCRTNVIVFPQVLNACKHIFCAKCIHEHYIVDNKEQCPTCTAYICPSDNPSYYDYYDDERYLLYDSYDEEWLRDEEEPCCPCASKDCPGGCGALPCGCIDTCRGRCEDREQLWWSLATIINYYLNNYHIYHIFLWNKRSSYSPR